MENKEEQDTNLCFCKEVGSMRHPHIHMKLWNDEIEPIDELMIEPITEMAKAELLTQECCQGGDIDPGMPERGEGAAFVSFWSKKEDDLSFHYGMQDAGFNVSKAYSGKGDEEWDLFFLWTWNPDIELKTKTEAEELNIRFLKTIIELAKQSKNYKK